jgi:putative hydrolase of the HAD superfamily
VIRAVIFDLYDTLIWRDEAVTARARAQIAALLGLSFDELNRRSRLHRDERMLGTIATIEALYALVAAEAGCEVGPQSIAEAARLERASLAESVGAYANSAAVLRELRGLGFRLGLLSNSSDTAALPLACLHWESLFDAVVLSHLEGVLKPDQRIYHIASERLGVPSADCVYVADGGFGELDAAHEHGMLTVKIEQDRQSSDYGSSRYYDHLVRDVAELLPLARAWRAAVR